MSGKTTLIPIEFRLKFCSKEDPSTGCWNWQRSTSKAGYGYVGYLGEKKLAHRLAYETFKGPIEPPSLFVMHTCDNPSCINPDHLVLGTQADNMADAARKGRVRRGSESGRSKLTDDQVLEISRLYSTGQYSQAQLAQRFGICHPTISGIVSGKRWKHLNVALPVRKGRGSPGDKNGLRLHPESIVRGSAHPRSKLTEEQTKRLRSLAPMLTHHQLAKRFGISQAQAGRIVRGESRKVD